MAARVVNLDGFRELETALNRLPTLATQRNVLRRVARGALEPIADDAQRRAPRASGNLQISISVSEQRTRRAKRNFRFDRKTGVEMAAGPSGGTGALYYATHVEFGTVDTAPEPYMRPAWDGGADEALEFVKDNLWREIDKAAQRVARKGARALRLGL